MRKLTLEEIRRDAARRGGRCLSETYVDSLTLMDWECAQRHRWVHSRCPPGWNSAGYKGHGDK